MAPYNNAPGTGTRNGRSTDRGAGAGALVGGALFVSVIALCALFIAYEGIYRLAAIVHADSTLPLAHVFPVTFTLLVLMAFWVSYLLRAAPPRERLWIDIGLIPLLILSAAVPMAVTRTDWFGRIGDTLPRGLTVVVAVAPLAALLVAFLLWIAVRAHVRHRGVQALPRPKPSDDRTTVLRGAPKPRSVPKERAPETSDALQTRLLRLGGEPRSAEEGEPQEESFRPGRDTATGEDGRDDAPHARNSASDRNRHRDEPEERERPEWFAHETHEVSPSPGDAPEVPTGPIPAPWDRSDDGELTETASYGTDRSSAEVSKVAGSGPTGFGSSTPMIPLPRRTRGGDNPIKRASTEAPVVPGAAAPEPEPARSTDSYTYTSDRHGDSEEEPFSASEHSADEGFAHEPDVGDPSSDEAEAPLSVPQAAPAATDVEAEPVEVAKPSDTLPGVRLFFPEHPPESMAVAEDSAVARPSESIEGFGSPPETPAEPATDAPIEPVNASAAGEPGGANEPDLPDDDIPLWEPPSEAHQSSALDDYVPPVWTPPEDDAPVSEAPVSPVDASGRRTDPAPGLALDHDTGPEVRAAFRLGAMPPGVARPGPEPHARAGRATEEDPPKWWRGPASEPGDEPEPFFGTEGTVAAAPPEPEEAVDREDEPRQADPRASIRRAKPLEKRPMVLKPPRPPMPDFASGPPSRRVRSEPLPPEDG